MQDILLFWLVFHWFRCNKNACICDIMMFYKCRTLRWHTDAHARSICVQCTIHTYTKENKTNDNSTLWLQNKYLDCISFWIECVCYPQYFIRFILGFFPPIWFIAHTYRAKCGFMLHLVNRLGDHCQQQQQLQT